MLPKKHLSGAAKRKLKRQEDQFIQSQKGVIHKFLKLWVVLFSTIILFVDAPNIEEQEQRQVYYPFSLNIVHQSLFNMLN